MRLEQNAGSRDLNYELINYLWNGSQVIPVEGNSGILHTKNCDEMKYLCYSNEIFMLLCGWFGHHNTNKTPTLFEPQICKKVGYEKLYGMNLQTKYL